MSEKIDGIYHEEKEISAGTMGTARTHGGAHALHYYAKSTDDGQHVILYYLKPDGTATALEVDRVSADAFAARFKPTPKEKFAVKTDDEKVKEEADKKVAVAERHLEKKEYHAAAFEYGQAIKKDGTNLKAHLGKGKAHMELGEHDKAKEAFEQLSQIDTLYDAENKHIFNEYGIELRRGEMYDLAIENYQKAIDIDGADEALWFNMARAFQEKGEISEALKNLEKALSINPEFKEAQLLRNALQKK